MRPFLNITMGALPLATLPPMLPAQEISLEGRVQRYIGLTALWQI